MQGDLSDQDLATRNFAQFAPVSIRRSSDCAGRGPGLGSPHARPGAGGRHRRRGRRLLHPLLARPPRLGRRRPRRPRRVDERLDVPLRRPRRPAPELAVAHEDDDELGRPVPLARGGGRARDGLEGGRLAAARVVTGAHGGDRAPGGMGEDLRPSAGARLGRRGARALSAHDHRRSAGRGLPADRRLHRPEPAHARARRGSPATRGGGQHRDARDGHSPRTRPRPGGRDRPRRDRDGGRRERRRDVRVRDRSARGSDRADRPDGARVPRHEALGPPDRHADDARSVAARLLPAGVRRARHGRVRAAVRAVGARRDPRGLQLPLARRGLAAVRGAARERRRPRPCARPRWRSSGSSTAPRPSRPTASSSWGRPTFAGSGSPRASARTGWPAPAEWGSSWPSGSWTARRRSTSGTWTPAASAPPTGAGSTRSTGRARSTRRTTTSSTRATSGAQDGRCACLPRIRACGSTAPLFGEKSGWERANWFEPNAERGDESLRPRGWAGKLWSPAIGAEHAACREAVAIFDETSFAKIDVSGRGRRGLPRAISARTASPAASAP